MKFLSLFFIGLSLLLTSSIQKKSPQTIDELGKELFHVLKTDNWKKFDKLTLSLSQYEEVIATSGETVEEREKLMTTAEERIQKRDIEVRASLQNIKELGRLDGVRWESAIYLKTVQRKNFEKRPDNCEIEVYFLASTKVYRFWATDCVKHDEDWYLAFRKLRWVGEDL